MLEFFIKGLTHIGAIFFVRAFTLLMGKAGDALDIEYDEYKGSWVSAWAMASVFLILLIEGVAA